MRPKERQMEIVDMVRQQGRISVESLASSFCTSHETIRRDLTVLANSGKIGKVHGGAVLPSMSAEGPFRQRMGENVAAKRKIARQASRLISPGDTLFVDTGSTTLAFAEEIAGIRNLTIITNSAEIARIVGSSNGTSRLFLVGGTYDADNRQTVGLMAITQLESFRANHAVISAGGIDADAGVMNFDFNEAQIAKTMIAQSGNVVVIADTSKFNRIAPFSVCNLNEMDQLVCEREPGVGMEPVLRRHDVEVIC